MDCLSHFAVRRSDLPARRRVVLSNEFVREAIAGLPIRAALERPADDPHAGAAAAELELYGEADAVFASGTVTGWLEVACSRCIGTVRVPIEEAVHVTFLPKERMPAQECDEVELTEDDMDLFPYEGESVDLEPLLREQLVLAVPFAPLCRQECRGLCSQCGADLNEASCRCRRDVIDPRLAALQGWKGTQQTRGR